MELTLMMNCIIRAYDTLPKMYRTSILRSEAAAWCGAVAYQHKWCPGPSYASGLLWLDPRLSSRVDTNALVESTQSERGHPWEFERAWDIVRMRSNVTRSWYNRLFKLVGERLFIQKNPRVLMMSVKAVLRLANTRDHPGKIRVTT